MWSTYAVLVFYFEGSREEKQKSSEARDLIRKEMDAAKGVQASVAKNIAAMLHPLRMVEERFRNSVQYLEMNRIPTGPRINALRENLSALTTEDEEFLWSDQDRKLSAEHLAGIKRRIFDAVFKDLSDLLQHSAGELKSGKELLEQSREQIVQHLNQLDLSIRKKTRKYKKTFSKDVFRAFLTGKSIPIAIYIVALMHLAGSRFPIWHDVFYYFGY